MPNTHPPFPRGARAATIALSVFLLAPLLWQSPAARADVQPMAGRSQPGPSSEPLVLRDIRDRLRRGAINLAEAHRLRVLAVTRPEALPEGLRRVATADRARRLAGGVPGPSGTAVLVDAFQYLVRTGETDDTLQTLLEPPPDMEESLDSSDLPIRVSFKPGEEAYAQSVLEAAELSWQIQTERWGFYEPLMEPGFEPYRIHITPAGSGTAGYTSPYARNDATPWADCFTYIVIDPDLGGYAQSTMAHELNHAMQAAMDCAELSAYWENTSVYIQVQTLPRFADMALWSLSSFQAEPWRPLDDFDYGAGYQYGGSLWNFFLADTYADPGDAGPILIRRIWEASMQDDFQNSVPYFDGIDAVITEETGDASAFDHALADFCEARYFVGGNDDGQHIQGAADWTHATVRVAARHTTAILPFEPAARPESDRRPEGTGCNHVLFDLPPTYPYPLRVTFDGDDDTRWAVRVLRITSDQQVSSTPLALEAPDWAGEVTLDTTGYRRLLLVVTNLGPAEDRTGPSHRVAHSYRYNAWPEVPPPTLTSVEPPQIEAGQQHLTVHLLGSGFVNGPGFEVAFEDPDIQIESVDGVTQEVITLTVTVPHATALGPKTIVVTNLGGEAARATDLVEVVAPPEPHRSPRGCHCGAADPQNQGPLPSALGWLMGLLLLGWLRRRVGAARGGSSHS